MKNKTLVKISALFILVLVLLAIKIKTPQFSKGENQYKQIASQINKDSIQTITIKKRDKIVKLEKKNENWMVGGRSADKNKVEEILNKVFTTENVETVAETDKNHKDLNLLKEDALSVSFDDKKTLLIGKSDYQGAFVRWDGEAKVYLLSDISSYSLDTDPLSWADKTVFSAGRDKITRINFSSSTVKKNIFKKEDKWIIEKDNKEANKDKVEPILNTISNISAYSVPDESQIAKYPKKEETSIYIEYDGKKETLLFYKGSTDYLVKRASDILYFIVGEPTLKTLTENFQAI